MEELQTLPKSGQDGPKQGRDYNSMANVDEHRDDDHLLGKMDICVCVCVCVYVFVFRCLSVHVCVAVGALP